MTPDPNATPAATDEDISRFGENWSFEYANASANNGRRLIARIEQDRQKIATLEAENAAMKRDMAADAEAEADHFKMLATLEARIKELESR